MLDVTVLTLFPEMFHGILCHSMVKRAIDSGAVNVNLVNFRDYATDKHRTVDDTPFGGGAGMLLKPGPLFEAIESVTKRETSNGSEGSHGDHSGSSHKDYVGDLGHDRAADASRERVVLMTPQGRPFTHDLAVEFSKSHRLVLLCGHYEGVDERVKQRLITDEISLGDFVLTGGEIPAMAIIDAVIRFLPGVLGNEDSAHTDSFASGLLEYPQYTRPAEFRGMKVPETLLSGNHKRIEEWRHVHALYRTWVRRPDLISAYDLSPTDREWVNRWERGDFTGIDVVEAKDL